MSDRYTVCQHGGLRRQCRICELEADLAAAEDRERRLRAALEQIASDGCRSYVRTDCLRQKRTRDAEYTADRWCDACIAREALAVAAAPEPGQTQQGPPLSNRHGHTFGRPYQDGYATCRCGVAENSAAACLPCGAAPEPAQREEFAPPMTNCVGCAQAWPVVLLHDGAWHLDTENRPKKCDAFGAPTGEPPDAVR